MKHHPRASNWKRALHTLYLVQPVLQFLLLAVAITALSRCSPLAPSSNKGPLKNILGSSSEKSEGVSALLNANWVDQSLTLVSETEMALTSEQSINEELKGIQEARAEVNRFVSIEPSATAQMARAPALLIKLSHESLVKLIANGKVRHDLSENLAQLRPEDMNEALLRLRDRPELINATAQLILPDELISVHRDAKLKVRISIAVLDAQHAVLQVSHRLSDERPEEREARIRALNNAALDAKRLAIIID